MVKNNLSANQNFMSRILVFIFICGFHSLQAQVTLDADGISDTYDLISSVLAPGNNPIEVPDCNHNAFGDHIDQIFDDELNDFVFRFHLHTQPDNDRCLNFDRQRNEIKSFAPSLERWRLPLPPVTCGIFRSASSTLCTTNSGRPPAARIKFAANWSRSSISAFRTCSGVNF